MSLNKKGLSLVELLVTLLIILIIIPAFYTLYLFASGGFDREAAHIKNQASIRNAMSYIVKEIRRADSVEITDGNLKLNGSDLYKLEDNILKKNGRHVVEGIQSFTAGKDGNRITVTIVSIPDKKGDSISLSSEITIRE